MEITSYDEKKALPVGIVMEVTDPGYWRGQLWIKTGDSRWATLGDWRSKEIVPDEELAKIVAAGEINVSPCPSDTLGFPEAYADWNFNILVGGTIQAARAAEVLRQRKALLDQRSANALRELMGIGEGK